MIVILLHDWNAKFTRPQRLESRKCRYNLKIRHCSPEKLRYPAMVVWVAESEGMGGWMYRFEWVSLKVWVGGSEGWVG